MPSSPVDVSSPEKLVFQSIDEFADAVSTLTVPWHIGPSSSPFAGGMRRRSFAHCLFGEMQYSGCTGVRDSRELALSDQSYICLSVYTKGMLNFTQGGSTTQVSAHDVLLWNGAKPSMFDCLEPTRCELVWIPTEIVERRLGPVSDYLGQAASAQQGPAKLLAHHMQMLHATIGDLPDAMRCSVMDASIDLIFACFHPRGPTVKSSPRASELLAEAKLEIARRVEWGELRPSDVAQALGISLRYLHKIFAATETTFSGYVTSQRLELARVALKNPRLQQQTLTELAHHFGFYDLSHFNRSFVRRYGVRPAIYRASI